MNIDQAPPTIPPALLLPNEITIFVFSFLDYFELMTVESTCKQWKQIASDSTLWKPHYLSLSDGWLPNDEPKSWKVLIKRTFYIEHCMWECRKSKGDQVYPSPYERKRRRIESKLNHFAYLKTAENALFVFYNLCGGPQFFHKIPLSDGIHDPSNYSLLPENDKRNVITREPDSKSFRFESSVKEERSTKFGICVVTYSKKLKGVQCTFSRYVRGLPTKEWILTQNGMISNHRRYNSIKGLIQSKICEQLKPTASSPSSSCHEESTHD